MPLPFHTLAVTVTVAVALLLLTATSDPDDEHCLTHLHQSLQDPYQNLQNWTKSAFSDPCHGFTSILAGITCNNGRIFKLILPNLSLSGTISPYLSNCTNLQTLDLSSNSISGQIPSDLQSLVNLAVLNLSHNRLSGNIPNELARCAYLNVIDFQDNRLSGGIPVQLGMLVRLTAFDVSKNRLSGSIPGSLGRFNVRSYEGNKELYGYPLGEMKKRGLSIVAIVGIGLGSGVVSLVVSFTAVCIWLRVSEKKMEMRGGSWSSKGGGGHQHIMPHY